MKLNPVELALVNNPLRSLLLRATVSRLHDAACAPPLERVLEIGCGVGAGVEEILRRFRPGAIDAFDLDEAQVARARARLAGRSRNGLELRLWVGDRNQHLGCGLLTMPAALNGREFDRLIVVDVVAVEMTEKALNGQQHGPSRRLSSTLVVLRSKTRDR